VVLYVILSGKVSGWNGGLGQNGWGPGYLGEYGMGAALIYEVVATFLFLVCILGVTQRGAPVGIAGLAIGLTLIAIHLFGINITGTSVNPARSLGPAIVGAGANPERLAQVWLFIVAPLIGAGMAGYLFKSGILAADDVVPDRGGGGRTEVAPGAIGTGQAAVVADTWARQTESLRFGPAPFRPVFLVAVDDAWERRKPRVAPDRPQFVGRLPQPGLVEQSWVDVDLIWPRIMRVDL
jgi:hypothetical protein